MILDTLAAAQRYVAIHPRLVAGFAFLAQGDLASLSDGRHEIDGTRVFALVSRDAGRGQAGARLEVHRKYLDIQVAIEGDERFGWRPLADCHQVAEPFDAERDVGFFADPPIVWLPLVVGQFAIFFPADAHAPLAGQGAVRKVVIKVEV
jgi:YhcH/YjgK/YiaL family protein